MSDDTHEAPERIFVTGNATTGSWNAAPATFRGPVEIEFIRADVVEAMAARAHVSFLEHLADITVGIYTDIDLELREMIAAERERCAEVDEILAGLKGGTNEWH